MRRCYLNRVSVSLLIYLFYLVALTLAPFDFTLAALAERTLGWGKRTISDFVLNILGFVPFGVILYFLARPDSKKTISKWALPAGTSAILSFSVETGQMFLSTRISSPWDLLANTLGGGLGFWTAHHLHQERWIVRLQRYRRTLVLSGLSLYLGGLIALFIWAANAQKLRGWDPSYSLLIGNEATLDRPWLGKIFLLALYDRVLRAHEIESQFQAGPHFEPEVKLEGAPMALYTFQEAGGTRVHDLSPVGPPLDLEIGNPQKAIWLPKGGLELTGATVLRSSERPGKVYQRFTATDTFSVVAWIQPKDSLQVGPARIVSFSLNPYLRNFTLGQEESEMHFRVRNRLAGPNGDRVNLRTKGLQLSPQPTHVVAIYDRGTERLYVNGVLFQALDAQDSLMLIAQVFHFDAASHWQRGLLMLLLLGPVGGCSVLLREEQNRLR